VLLKAQLDLKQKHLIMTVHDCVMLLKLHQKHSNIILSYGVGQFNM